MKRKELLFIIDIDEAIAKILKYLEDVSEEHFLTNELIQDAVIHNLEIIGEAVKSISDEIRIANPDIPWRSIAGLRDVLIHEYFGVQVHRIWLITQNELKEISPRIAELRKGLEGPSLFESN